VAGLLGATPSLVAAPVSAAGVTQLAPRASTMAAETFEHRVQRWVNVERRRHGLRGLRINRCSDGTAERWSRHLARRDLFVHQPMSRILNRCDAWYAGETLARGSMGPRRLVRMWMNSPPHRAIVLSPEPRRIGIGATLDNRGRWVTTANFIRP
jgi:uncharacterized protein YkwD